MPLLHLEPLLPRTSKGDLLRLLSVTGGLNRERVGRIEIQGATAVIEVPSDWSQRLAKTLDGFAFQGRRLRAWSTGEATSGGSTDAHFQRLTHLLNLEAEAEARQILENAKPAGEGECNGTSLLGLAIIDESSGLGGRCLLTLAKRNRTQGLPWHRLEPGTPVLLSAEKQADREGLAPWSANAENGPLASLCQSLPMMTNARHPTDWISAPTKSVGSGSGLPWKEPRMPSVAVWPSCVGFFWVRHRPAFPRNNPWPLWRTPSIRPSATPSVSPCRPAIWPLSTALQEQAKRRRLSN